MQSFLPSLATTTSLSVCLVGQRWLSQVDPTVMDFRSGGEVAVERRREWESRASDRDCVDKQSITCSDRCEVNSGCAVDRQTTASIGGGYEVSGIVKL